MKALIALVASTLLLQMGGCGIFPEASFELSNDSRLPKWFSLPPGLEREQVTIHMDYYAAPWGRRATVTMLDPGMRTLAKVTASLRGGQPLSSQGQATGTYPSYEVLEADGVVDIVEHRRMEPKFWMTDDAAVWRVLAAKK